MIRWKLAIVLTLLGIFFFSLKGILVKLPHEAGATPLILPIFQNGFCGVSISIF